MPQRVLVTGGTGFIARHVTRELLAHGYAVRATVRSATAALAEGVEVVRADLGSDDGWAEAVAGCDHVMHVASPFPSSEPADENDLIRPAVDGTLRVLRAAEASGTVKRVVLTSSIAAIRIRPDRADPRVHTEADWSDLDHCAAYAKSKTLAERAAWDFVAESPRRVELVVVNPGSVLGPLDGAATSTTVEVVRRLMTREIPAPLRMALAVVDVRDLAVGHRLALESPRAAGQRYILAGGETWMPELARLLADEYNGRGLRVSTTTIPSPVVRFAARFAPPLRVVLSLLDRRELVTSAKARTELGWAMRPLRETVVDTADSLIAEGFVTPRGGRNQVPSRSR
ncbi:aldehyde reductase [Lentzea sp. HUAS12]|uniref:SDR family oxidoreductase n=1 Tax=Lentzea sp. HUAS12 TaxID=2951806 RepID=UPI00209E5EA1|nr:aldehyde reductase [Lentzea sp. HUAS12]USX52914.1 aldehyde reductase [Lentzea sp. HUAS12]